MAHLNWITAGESHGPQLTAVVVGLPSGLSLSRAQLDHQLARRQAGYGRSPRQRLETDTAAITAGVRHGCTLGSPIALTIVNADHANWNAAMAIWPTQEQQGNWRDHDATVPRPGHADLAGIARHNFTSLRPVLERASARETAARVAAGALAQQLLAALGVEVRAHVRSIGDVASARPVPRRDDWMALAKSRVCALDEHAEAQMIERIDRARKERDTLGGVIEIVAYGLPIGLGGYTTSNERLDGRLAGAAMSVQAIKGVEIGDAFASAAASGVTAHDPLYPAAEQAADLAVTRTSNRAGGIEGGMTNGAPIVMRAAMKPLATLMSPLPSVDIATGEAVAAHAERSDVCAVPAAAVVLECAVAFELARVVREQFGSASFDDVRAAWSAYCTRVGHTWAPVPLADAAEHDRSLADVSEL